MARISTAKPVTLAASFIQWTPAIDRNQLDIGLQIQPTHPLERESNEKPLSRKASTCVKASMANNELLLSSV